MFFDFLAALGLIRWGGVTLWCFVHSGYSATVADLSRAVGREIAAASPTLGRDREVSDRLVLRAFENKNVNLSRNRKLVELVPEGERLKGGYMAEFEFEPAPKIEVDLFLESHVRVVERNQIQTLQQQNTNIITGTSATIGRATGYRFACEFVKFTIGKRSV